MSTKQCNTCLQEKDTNEFPCYKGKPAGGKCKKCYADHCLIKRGQSRKLTYRPELTSLEKNNIVSLFLDGLAISQLTKKFNVNRETVRQLLRFNKIPFLTQEEKEKRREVCQKEQIEDQLNQLELKTGKTTPERKKEASARRRKRVTDVIFNTLMGKTCVDCGEADLLVLQFDHRDPKQKERDISKCSTVTSVLRELPKCDIVCANCHTRRTQKMFGSWRLKLQTAIAID